MGPAVLLFILAPVMGELLSGSSPPLTFFSPIGLIVQSILYGGGALLIRECRIRRRKDWGSLLLLGAAYGIIEEGLLMKTFFDPHWKDVGLLGSYGRWHGVNWVWAVQLTVYHAVVSIAIPVLLTELTLTQRRNEPWLSNRAICVLSTLFVLNGVFIFLAITPYRPPLVPYLGAVMVTALLILAAVKRRSPETPEALPARCRPWQFGLAGFFGITALYALGWVLPYTSVRWQATLALTVLLVWGVGKLLRRMSAAGRAWDDRHRFSLAAGALWFYILLALPQDFIAGRNPARIGMTVVGILGMVGLFWLHRRMGEQMTVDS